MSGALPAIFLNICESKCLERRDTEGLNRGAAACNSEDACRAIALIMQGLGLSANQ